MASCYMLYSVSVHPSDAGHEYSLELLNSVLHTVRFLCFYVSFLGFIPRIGLLNLFSQRCFIMPYTH